MSSLESQGIPLHFTWCPAHCDIKENEQADVLAGTAANKREAEVIVLRPRSVFASDIRQERARANERRRTVLRNSRDDNHERLSRLLVTPIPEWFRAHGERPQQSVLAQLRLGHVPLNYHLSRMGEGSPTCMCDGESWETVRHFLLSCGQYTNMRRLLISQVRDVTGIKSDALVDDRVLLGGWRFPKEIQLKIADHLYQYVRGTQRLNLFKGPDRGRQ